MNSMAERFASGQMSEKKFVLTNFQAKDFGKTQCAEKIIHDFSRNSQITNIINNISRW